MARNDSKKQEERPVRKPPSPLDEYVEAQPLLRHVRVMNRFMDWVDEDPKTREFYSELHCAYMDILAEELAPHALTLALAITELEDAYPEIERNEPEGSEADRAFHLARGRERQKSPENEKTRR